MARINLVPQRREFYDLYNRAADNNVAIARLLVQLLEGFPNDRDTSRATSRTRSTRATA